MYRRGARSIIFLYHACRSGVVIYVRLAGNMLVVKVACNHYSVCLYFVGLVLYVKFKFKAVASAQSASVHVQQIAARERRRRDGGRDFKAVPVSAYRDQSRIIFVFSFRLKNVSVSGFQRRKRDVIRLVYDGSRNVLCFRVCRVLYKYSRDRSRVFKWVGTKGYVASCFCSVIVALVKVHF